MRYSMGSFMTSRSESEFESGSDSKLLIVGCSERELRRCCGRTDHGLESKHRQCKLVYKLFYVEQVPMLFLQYAFRRPADSKKKALSVLFVPDFVDMKCS